MFGAITSYITPQTVKENIAGCPKRAAASLQSTERLNELEKARYVRLHVSVPHPFHQIPP